MAQLFQKFRAGQEHLAESVIAAPEKLKESVLNNVHGTMEYLKGSGSLKTEIGGLVGNNVNVLKHTGETAIQDTADVIRLRGDKVFMDTITGLGKVTKDLGKMMFAGIPLAKATASEGWDLSKKILKSPYTVPKGAIGMGVNVVKKQLNGLAEIESKFDKWNKGTSVEPITTEEPPQSTPSAGPQA